MSLVLINQQLIVRFEFLDYYPSLCPSNQQALHSTDNEIDYKIKYKIIDYIINYNKI